MREGLFLGRVFGWRCEIIDHCICDPFMIGTLVENESDIDVHNFRFRILRWILLLHSCQQFIRRMRMRFLTSFEEIVTKQNLSRITKTLAEID